MRTVAVPISVLLVSVGVVMAAPDGENVMTIGAGNRSCGAWLAARNDPGQHYQYQQWLFGYLTAYNYYTRQKQAVPPDGDATVAWIDNYCKANPMHALSSGAAALVQELGGTKALHQWKK